MNSWRTSITGIGTIVVAIATLIVAFFDGDPKTEPSLTIAFAQILVGIGLITARDNRVTDREAMGSEKKAEKDTAVIYKEQGLDIKP